MTSESWTEYREMLEDGMDDSLAVWAVQQAANANALNWAYIRKVLNNKLSSGIKTRVQAEAADKKRETHQTKKQVSAQQYEQRNYETDVLDRLANDALEEVRRMKEVSA